MSLQPQGTKISLQSCFKTVRTKLQIVLDAVCVELARNDIENVMRNHAQCLTTLYILLVIGRVSLEYAHRVGTVFTTIIKQTPPVSRPVMFEHLRQLRLPTFEDRTSDYLPSIALTMNYRQLQTRHQQLRKARLLLRHAKLPQAWLTGCLDREDCIVQRRLAEMGFALLKLPAELRSCIYEYALSLPENDQFTCLQPGSCYESTCQAHETNPSTPPLTQVNRQLRKETLAMFYNSNVFRIDIRDVGGWLNRLRKANITPPTRTILLLPHVLSSKGAPGFDITSYIKLMACTNAILHPRCTHLFLPGWKIGASHVDLTPNPTFWSLVNWDWLEWMVPRLGHPAVIHCVILRFKWWTDHSLTFEVCIEFDDEHVMIQESGTALELCRKVHGSLCRGVQGEVLRRGLVEFVPVTVQK
ncbi:hypothetical protein EJ08DRAFT_731070 [Tothia fuscella]|uniref:2EXR domain-containing protein n=1 Tax=Tothia fuscella TaxID=1048955 RepID=A0A9P4NYA7_9PEZI|nr:hypothetical protein EJ08DRAFT_731070 [Tothia fuscella]